MRVRLPLPLLAAFGAALLLAAACAMEENAPVPATATATSTGTEQDGADGFRAFARQADAALKRGDAAFLANRMKTVDIICTAADVNPQGAGGPECKVAGERFKGFETATWRSEGAISPVENTVRQLEAALTSADPKASDAYGRGAPRVHSLNVEPGSYTIIFTAIVTQPWRSDTAGPFRAVFASSWQFGEGRWQMTRLLTAYVLAGELLTPGSEYTNRLKAREEFQQ